MKDYRNIFVFLDRLVYRLCFYLEHLACDREYRLYSRMLAGKTEITDENLEVIRKRVFTMPEGVEQSSLYRCVLQLERQREAKKKQQ